MKDMLPKIQNFEDFQNLKGCFFWVNLIEFDSICIDLRRSTSIHIDPHSFASIWTLRFHRFFGYIKILTHFSLFIIWMKDMLPKIQNFEDFQNLKGCFFWVNLIEFDSICIDLRRSTSIHIDPHSFASIWTLRFHRFFGYIKILTHFSLFIWERSTTDPSGDSQIAWV